MELAVNLSSIFACVCLGLLFLVLGFVGSKAIAHWEIRQLHQAEQLDAAVRKAATDLQDAAISQAYREIRMARWAIRDSQKTRLDAGRLCTPEITPWEPSQNPSTAPPSDRFRIDREA